MGIGQLHTKPLQPTNQGANSKSVLWRMCTARRQFVLILLHDATIYMLLLVDSATASSPWKGSSPSLTMRPLASQAFHCSTHPLFLRVPGSPHNGAAIKDILASGHWRGAPERRRWRRPTLIPTCKMHACLRLIRQEPALLLRHARRCPIRQKMPPRPQTPVLPYPHALCINERHQCCCTAHARYFLVRYSSYHPGTGIT